jgi:hypothetical protein
MTGNFETFNFTKGYNVPNTISFSELMNSDDKYVLIGLSKYVKIVMSVFK